MDEWKTLGSSSSVTEVGGICEKSCVMRFIIVSESLIPLVDILGVIRNPNKEQKHPLDGH